MEELVSIIVPVYNTEKYLKECLDSILKQNHSNLEAIFIDDGSTDSSLAILESYAKKDKRIKIISQKNQGASAARNRGLKEAKGKYITFVDSDDYITADYVEYFCNLAKSNDAEIIVTTEYLSTYDATRNESDDKICSKNRTEALEGLLSYRIPVWVYSKMFDREFLKKNKTKFDENLKIGEDFLFNTEAFSLANNIIVGQKGVYFYRRDNSTSITKTFSVAKCKDGLLAVDKIEKIVKEFSSSIQKAFSFAKWRTYTDMYDQMSLSGVNKKEAIYRKCRKYVRWHAFSSFKTQTSTAQKIRAIVFWVNPDIVVWAMRKRAMNSANSGETE